MPELPEVETVVRELRGHLIGRRISAVRVGGKNLRRPWNRRWTPTLVGRKIEAVRRRGKWIVIELDQGRIIFHLGMTGQLLVVHREEPRAPHTHVIMDLNGKKQLRFRDVRRFGSMTLFSGHMQVDEFFKKTGLGPEPFDLKPEYWRDCLANTMRSLKAVLLDQRVLAGVGNIYADEALFEARLAPMRHGEDVRPEEAGRLRRAIITVLNRAIDRRGSSIRDYVDGSGNQGSYQDEFRVYGRTGQPCRRCGRSIRRIRLAGRSTFYCPKCQRR